jgi:hypothetical protein
MTPTEAIHVIRQVQAAFTATGADHAKITEAIEVLVEALTPPPPEH